MGFSELFGDTSHAVLAEQVGFTVLYCAVCAHLPLALPAHHPVTSAKVVAVKG
jgi:hypothetical protein